MARNPRASLTKPPAIDGRVVPTPVQGHPLMSCLRQPARGCVLRCRGFEVGRRLTGDGAECFVDRERLGEIAQEPVGGSGCSWVAQRRGVGKLEVGAELEVAREQGSGLQGELLVALGGIGPGYRGRGVDGGAEPAVSPAGVERYLDVIARRRLWSEGWAIADEWFEDDRG